MLGEWHWEAGTKSALGFFSSVGTDLPRCPLPLALFFFFFLMALDCTIFVFITHVSFRAIYLPFLMNVRNVIKLEAY